MTFYKIYVILTLIQTSLQPLLKSKGLKNMENKPILDTILKSKQTEELTKFNPTLVVSTLFSVSASSDFRFLFCRQTLKVLLGLLETEEEEEEEVVVVGSLKNQIAQS